MRKKLLIVFVFFAVGVLALVGYYNIHIKKQWEVPKKETSESPQVKTDITLPSQKGKINIEKKPITQEPTRLTVKKPERCKELMEKRSKATDFKGGLTSKEEDYLRAVCRIPISRSPIDTIRILKWWKDEDGYDDMMWVNLDELAHFVKWPGAELTGVVEPIKNIALNSKFPLLREQAVIALHEITREKSIPTFIDKKKSIPIFKEVLRREVEEREITNESRQSIIKAVGYILSKEGEYDYAFPYLMKAKIFEFSTDRGDLNALEYIKTALTENDEGLKLQAALSLLRLGKEENRELIFKTAVTVLRTSKDGAYRDIAIYILTELKDKRALPVLEEQLRIENSYIKDNILKSIQIIKGN